MYALVTNYVGYSGAILLSLTGALLRDTACHVLCSMMVLSSLSSIRTEFSCLENS